MREHLIFTLTAAMGAMGELAGHERRGTWTWPGRSAILGLLAAARGIRRDGDFSALDRLSISVAVFDAGTPLRDYHTVQTIPTTKARRPQSRPLALKEAGDEINTTITLRDYRSCPLFGVTVTGDGLTDLRAALEHPAFVLYLGRKNCPLGAPLAPRIVTAPDAESALKHLRLPPWWPIDKAVAKVLIGDFDGQDMAMTETRHDSPLDRRLWHFSERRFLRQNVCIAPLEQES